MTDATLPISYAEAREVVARWIFRISRAGPDVFAETTREKYAEDLDLLKQAAAVLGMHADRSARRAGEAGQR